WTACIPGGYNVAFSMPILGGWAWIAPVVGRETFMYQSWLLLAVAGFGAGPSGDVTWQTDYGVARKAAAKERKPLVVVIGSGLMGYNELAREGVLQDEARRLLSNQYVCLYLDTLTPAGGRQARDFQVGDLGIVISDRSGTFQAFRHEGDL